MAQGPAGIGRRIEVALFSGAFGRIAFDEPAIVVNAQCAAEVNIGCRVVFQRGARGPARCGESGAGKWSPGVFRTQGRVVHQIEDVEQGFGLVDIAIRFKV